jgi:dGTPase
MRAARRLRAQPAEPARGRPAGARYPAFDGLNLTLRDARRHPQALLAPQRRALERREPGGVARRFLRRHQPSLEAQLVNLADEIAYNAHDIDDGVRSGLLDAGAAARGAAVRAACREPCWPSTRRWPRPGGGCCTRRCAACCRPRCTTWSHTRARRWRSGERPADADACAPAPPLVAFSPAMRDETAELKRFLFRALYRHPQVVRPRRRAQVVVELFAAYRSAPQARCPPTTPRRADPAARRGRLHRRHDRPLRAARAPAADRAATVRDRCPAR